jgi:hypothetical protein
MAHGAAVRVCVCARARVCVCVCGVCGVCVDSALSPRLSGAAPPEIESYGRMPGMNCAFICGGYPPYIDILSPGDCQAQKVA